MSALSPGGLVTVVIVPRERFSVATQSLEQILAKTPEDVAVVYVEGNAPRSVRSALHRAGGERTTFLSSAVYLSPNEARNLGFGEVSTPYVVFLDNDVRVETGWLEALISCAQEHDAAVVGPLYLQGSHEEPEVHMAGGLAHIVERDGQRRLRHSHRFQGRPLEEVRPQIVCEETEQIEFHGVLVKSETLRALGGLDEGLLNTREHIDFCMSVREAGEKIFLEPRSLLTYTRPPPFAPSDLRFYSLRWSEDWSVRTLDHFFEKWNLDRGQIPHLMAWTKKQRYRFLDPWYSRTTRWLARSVGEERMIRMLRYTLYPLEGALNRLLNAALGARRSKSDKAVLPDR